MLFEDLVTVGITVCEKTFPYLGITLDSLSRKHKIVIVSDGDVPGLDDYIKTANVIRELNMEVYSGKKQDNPAPLRNYLMQTLTSKYLRFVDAGDTVDYVEQQVEYMRHNEAVQLCATNAYVFGAKYDYQENLVSHLISLDNPRTSTFMVRRYCPYRWAEYPAMTDLDFLLRVLEGGDKVTVLPYYSKWNPTPGGLSVGRNDHHLRSFFQARIHRLIREGVL